MPKRSAPLTARERAFVLAYTGRARGNGTRAAILAGYTANSARSTASKLLAKSNIGLALAKLAKTEEQKAERARLTHAKRDEILEQCALDEGASWKDRRAAITELNRVDGRHSVKHVHEGTLSLEDVLSKSWEDD